MKSLGEDAADTVLQRAVPNVGPTRIAGVVVQLAQERRHPQKIEGAAGEPSREGAQKLVPFVWEHADRQGPGIALAAKATAQMGAEGKEFFLTQAHGDNCLLYTSDAADE